LQISQDFSAILDEGKFVREACSAGSHAEDHYFSFLILCDEDGGLVVHKLIEFSGSPLCGSWRCEVRAAVRSSQFDPEAAAFTRVGVSADAAAHAFGDLSDDGETDAGTFVIGCEPLKHAKEARLGRSGYADAIIFNSYADEVGGIEWDFWISGLIRTGVTRRWSIRVL